MIREVTITTHCARPRRPGAAVVGFVVVTVCFLPVSARSADAPSAAASQPASSALADQQAVILTRFQRLEDRMYKLSDALSGTEPQQAARLREALAAGRRLLLRQQIQQAVTALQSAKLSEASDAQEKLTADLTRLLGVLLDEASPDVDNQEEIDRLQALREQVDRLIAEQQRELGESEKAAASKKRREQAAAMEQRLSGLLDAQRALSREAGGPSPAEDQSEKAARTSGEESTPGDSLSKRQRALGEETRGVGEQIEPSPAESEANGEKSAGGESGEREAVDRAAEAMERAAKALEADRKPDAEKAQRQAEAALESAIDRLKNEIEALDKSADLERQAAEQGATADATQKTAEQMRGQTTENKPGQPGDRSEPPESQPPGGESPDGEKGAPSPSKGGEQQKGGASGESQPPGEGAKKSPAESSPESQQPQDAPAPGRDRVAEAVPHQRDAEKKLKEKDAAAAAESQKKALERLDAAKKELADTLEQLRREQQEELLAALEARFAAMLARQIDLNKQTNRLDTIGRDKWSRSDQLQLGETSRGQEWVAAEAETAARILEEDGSTVAMPQLVEQVRDDARLAAKRVSASDTSSDVRQIQESIVLTLEELISAVRERQKQMDGDQNEGAPSASGEQQAPSLIPGSAELKLLRACQVRVNRETFELERARVWPTLSPAGLPERLQRNAERQASVARMTLEMLEGERGHPAEAAP